MIGEQKEKISPQEVLMGCLADAERIEKIVIVVVGKDGFREYWSNLEDFERLGLMRLAQVRMETKIANYQDED